MNLEVKCPCCNEDIIIKIDKYCKVVGIEKSEVNNIELSENIIKDILKNNNIELG